MILCAASVFSVVDLAHGNNAPQRQREHRDCTEKSQNISDRVVV